MTLSDRPNPTNCHLLEMSGIEKSFPGVRALSGVSIQVRRGEVLALMGENGAGKSTLIRMLGGAHRPDRGEIRIDGAVVDLSSPAAAIKAGIGVIYQEFNQIPALSARENIFLGRERSRWRINRSEERAQAENLLSRLGLNLPLDIPCRYLSIAQQQLVEIAKALSQNVHILVMDEPTAALAPQEVERLFHVIRELQSQGIGIIYISHRLDEIFQISDAVTVLRDGRNVGHCATRELSRTRLIEMMVGRSIADEFPRQRTTPGNVRLGVRQFCRGDRVQNVSFDLKAGEILGITGLIGAGRTELVRLIFGADRLDSGTMELDGRAIRIRSPRDAIKAGICLLTEDRKSQGLVLCRSVRENFSLAGLLQFSRFGLLNQSLERACCESWVYTLRIRVSHQDQRSGNLSGGNQQKVVLARWMQQNADILIFDEPTRGIDIGAKQEIYQLMNQLTLAGKSIIMVSSELPEIIGMSDRILVMHQGRTTGEVPNTVGVTQQQLMELAIT